AETFVEIEARIVRDARQVNDGVHPFERARERRNVADVATVDRQTWMILREPFVPEQHPVVHDDLVALRQELRNEDAAFVPGSAGHEYLVLRGGHSHDCT